MILHKILKKQIKDMSIKDLIEINLEWEVDFLGNKRFSDYYKIEHDKSVKLMKICKVIKELEIY